MAATQRRTLGVLTYLILSVVAASRASDGEAGYVKNGVYIGGLFTYNNMSGDFDDSSYFLSSSGLYDAPDVDSGAGFGIVLGVRGDSGAMELGYQRSTHDTHSSFADIGASTATYNVVDLNFKVDLLQNVDFLARNRIKPYVLFGFGIPWLTVQNSATDGHSFEDETFVGVELAVGVGVAYYFHPQWAITGGVIHRWNWFGSVEGGSLDDSLLEKALGFTLGLAYTF
jgi:hypothetical protein